MSNFEKIMSFEKDSVYPESNAEMMEVISQNLGGGNTADGDLKADGIFGMMHTYLA
jgi:hypothetical protein